MARKAALKARKASAMHTANASTLAAAAESVAREADAAHKANASKLLSSEQHMAHKNDIAHQASAPKIVAMEEHATQVLDSELKNVASLKNVEADRDSAHNTSKLAVAALHQNIAYKANASAVKQDESSLQAEADLDIAHYMALEKTSKPLSKEELLADKVAILAKWQPDFSALELTRPLPSQALSSGIASLQPTTPPGTQPSAATEGELSSPGPSMLHLMASSVLSRDDGMNESVAMPAQGFEGDLVAHEDQRSMTADWQREHSTSDTTDAEKVCRICRDHMSNPWCQQKCPELMKAHSSTEPGTLAQASDASALDASERDASEPDVERPAESNKRTPMVLNLLLLIMSLVVLYCIVK